MSDAVLTHPITFSTSDDEGATFAELVEIKEFPDLASPPDAIEVTTLKDLQVVNIPGIKNNGEMTFVANYNKTDYDTVKDLEDTELFYLIEFGTDGADGAYAWKGKHVVTISGGGTNTAVEMQITVFASTEIKPEADWSFPIT